MPAAMVPPLPSLIFSPTSWPGLPLPGALLLLSRGPGGHSFLEGSSAFLSSWFMPTQSRPILTAMRSWPICLTSFGARLPEAPSVQTSPCLEGIIQPWNLAEILALAGADARR